MTLSEYDKYVLYAGFHDPRKLPDKVLIAAAARRQQGDDWDSNSCHMYTFFISETDCAAEQLEAKSRGLA